MSGYYQVHPWIRVKCPGPTSELLIHDNGTTLIPCRLHNFALLLWILDDGSQVDVWILGEAWILGEWSSFFSWSGHLDAVTCHAPLTWVGSLVSSILAMELKLTACPIVVDRMI